MPVGRPTDYQESFCEIARSLLAEGASKTEVAAILGTYRDGLIRWQEDNPEFSNAIREGEQLSEAWWEKKGRINLENKNFNTNLWFINMRNRHGWADKKDVNVSGNLNINLVDSFAGNNDTV